MRGVPDIAYQASSRTGVLVYMTEPATTTSGTGCGGANPCSTGWYVVKGSARYHVAGCQALDTSLTTEHVSSARHLGDLEPCRLCDAG